MIFLKKKQKKTMNEKEKKLENITRNNHTF